MSERYVSLRRAGSLPVFFNNYGAYRLRVDVEEFGGPGVDGRMFIYARQPPSPYTGENCDVFQAVAGPAQLAAYPPDNPDPNSGWPFYRLKYVELDCMSTQEADAIWKEIHQQVCGAMAAMNRLEVLVEQEKVWCPGPPDGYSVSSQSD